MNSLDEIAILVNEKPASECQVSANVKAILNEINSLMQVLLETGVSNTIDLRGLPLEPGEYESLKAILGEGEVSATLETMGSSKIIETQLSGVWWLFHDDENAERLAEFIEVTFMPTILKSDRVEVAAAKEALLEQLESLVE